LDRVIARTCSAGQAAVLSAAAGRFTLVRTSQVRIHPPAGRVPIDPASTDRYLARIELLDGDPGPERPAGGPEAEVVSDLFGLYLD
jgi:hypothetical protein